MGIKRKQERIKKGNEINVNVQSDTCLKKKNQLFFTAVRLLDLPCALDFYYSMNKWHSYLAMTHLMLTWPLTISAFFNETFI